MVLPLSARAGESAGDGLIIKLREPTTALQRDKSLKGPLRHAKSMRSDGRFKLIRVNSEREAAELKAEMARDPSVEYVETNQRAQALFAPNDPYFANGAQWNLLQIKAPAAWDIAPGAGSGVVVAVLDTGVAYEDHSDSLGDYRRVPDLSPESFVAGFDFVNHDSHPNDDHGHGTHVAGVIAQSTNNGYGAAGLAFGARIMPVKVLDKSGRGNLFDIADGIRWAAEHGAQVINLSLGIDHPSLSVKEAIKYARNEKKVTVVAAAGNSADSLGYDGGLMYPASYPSVISVGATRYSRIRASYSQWGSALDLVAPGGEMGLGLDQNGDGFPDGVVQETIKPADLGSPADPMSHGFYWGEGTSVAAPHVAAAAALLIGQGVTEPDSVFQALTNTAEDLGVAGFDDKYGYGLLNVAAALRYRKTSTTWYFAEGRTGKGFDTKITINNLSARAAKLRVVFTRPRGTKTIKRYNIGAHTRYTIAVDDVDGLGSGSVSTKVK